MSGSIVALKWGAFAATCLGVFGIAWALAADAQGPARRYWGAYIGFLERKLRMMFLFTPGRKIAMGQIAALFGVLAVHMLVGLPFWWFVVFLVAVVPARWIERMRRKRVAALEAQLDGFLLAMSNALKATPSIGDALISVVPLLQPPMRQEVDLAVKEMRVGSTLEQSLLQMAARVGSRQLDSALSAILIGRQIGGNLPQILETTSATLREMARLEGVVRTKTAEGKAQMWVLALFPFVLILALNALKDGYFDPLTETLVGYVLTSFAVLFWIASMIVARKVLAVDV